MRSMSLIMVMLVLAACGSGATTPTSNSQTESTAQVKVVTTMSILADIIKQVGGERVQVENIVPMGAGPEDYQATPGDSQKIANAQIIFFNGHGLEEWIEPLFENAGNPNQPRIELSATMKAIEDEEHAGDASGDEHGHEGGNPHFWLDPTYVMSYTTTIKDELSKLDPAGAASYSTNADNYIKQLQTLDADLQAQASQIPAERRILITNHDAFPYFAQRYGFTVAGVILPNPEAELSAGELSQLIDIIKQQNVPAIFSESQFNQKTAQLLADEAGVKTIGVLYTDTLGDDAKTYTDMMRYNMRTVVEALK